MLKNHLKTKNWKINFSNKIELAIEWKTHEPKCRVHKMATPNHFQIINKNQFFKKKSSSPSSGKRIEPKCEVHKMATPLSNFHCSNKNLPAIVWKYFLNLNKLYYKITRKSILSFFLASKHHWRQNQPEQ